MESGRTTHLKRELLRVLEQANATGPDGYHALANALLDGATTLLQDPRARVETIASLRTIAGYLTQLADAEIHEVHTVRKSFGRIALVVN